ncbi:MAG: dihydrodipicolinate reductase [Novosphingobium sp.]|nr:dihydrodipicolinate reductase [Novosphingobium sp.]
MTFRGNLPPDGRPLRVAQWATGLVGLASMRAVIADPRFELVALHAHSPAKIGRDAGELCGVAPIGVKATGSLTELLAARPDCVMYMREGYDLDEVCALLEAGCNVVTTRSEFLNPARMEAEFRGRLEDACRRGNSSLHSTGSSPGFITEAMPIVLTSIQRQFRSLVIDEYADMVLGCSREMLFDLLGYGQRVDAMPPERIAHIRESFAHSLELIADAIGLPLDGIETKHEMANALEPIRIPSGEVIETGTFAGERITIAGMRNGKAILTFRANWYCSTEIDAKWERRESGWRVVVDGDAPLDIAIRFPIPTDQIVATLPHYTANRPVNAIPYVCAAAPGIVTTVDMPQIIARFS